MGTVDHVVECRNPPVVDRYVLVIRELFSGGTMWIEVELGEIGQKSVNAQPREVKLVILFGGG